MEGRVYSMRINLVEHLAASAGTSVFTMKITMFMIMIGLTIVIIAIDAFAFENGAFATISQVCLTINTAFWPMTYLMAAFAGGLLLHLSVPRISGQADPPYTWIRYAVMWTPAFWAGVYVAFRWLRQLPNQD